MTALSSFGTDLNCIVIGSTGGIGAALVQQLCGSSQVASVHALSRTGKSVDHPKARNLTFDFLDPDSIEAAAQALREVGPFDIIITATGLLHSDSLQPEKNLRALSHDNFAQSFAVNTAGPAMTAQAFLPLLARDRKTVFAALSARVGSISDNRLGGWYAYRAAKAALNMVLKTLSIEWGRRFKQAVIIGLHPGTVATELSAPFSANVPEGKLFTPEFSAQKLLEVIDQVDSADSGKVFAWDGTEVPA